MWPANRPMSGLAKSLKKVYLSILHYYRSLEYIGERHEEGRKE